VPRADDDTLQKLDTCIHSRAVRRCSNSETQRQPDRDAGLCKRQGKTADRVGYVPCEGTRRVPTRHGLRDQEWPPMRPARGSGHRRVG